ncbi:hypothetical protein T484DRAFT_1753863 [Baffinella frigidus]|nr:hypothetical protein T484DRAFT_1753863 [Cryptophyta sp. CCMP2293]
MVKSVFIEPFGDHFESMFKFIFHEFKRLYVHYATYYEPLLTISYSSLNDTKAFDKFTKAFEDAAQMCTDILEAAPDTFEGTDRIVKYTNKMKLAESYPFDISQASTLAAFRSFAQAPKTPRYQKRNLFEWPVSTEGTSGITYKLHFEKLLLQTDPVRMFQDMVHADQNNNSAIGVTNAWNHLVHIPGKAYNYHVAIRHTPLDIQRLHDLYNNVHTYGDTIQTLVRNELGCPRTIKPTFSPVRNVKKSPIVHVVYNRSDMQPEVYQFLAITKDSNVVMVTLHLNWSEQNDLHILDIFNDMNTFLAEQIDIQLDHKTSVMHYVHPPTPVHNISATFIHHADPGTHFVHPPTVHIPGTVETEPFDDFGETLVAHPFEPPALIQPHAAETSFDPFGGANYASMVNLGRSSHQSTRHVNGPRSLSRTHNNGMSSSGISRYSRSSFDASSFGSAASHLSSVGVHESGRAAEDNEATSENRQRRQHPNIMGINFGNRSTATATNREKFHIRNSRQHEIDAARFKNPHLFPALELDMTDTADQILERYRINHGRSPQGVEDFSRV